MDLAELLKAEFTWHPNHMPQDPFGSLMELALGYNHLLLQAVSQAVGKYNWSPRDFLAALANERSELGFMARGSCLMLYASKIGTRAEVLGGLIACAQEFVLFKQSESFKTRIRILYGLVGLTALRTAPEDSDAKDRVTRANSLMLAAAAFLDADLPGAAGRSFDAIDWKLAEPNPELETFTVRLANVSSTLERRVGPRFYRRALHYWHQLLTREEVNGATLLAFEAAKGVLFASRFQNGGARMVFTPRNIAAVLGIGLQIRE